MPVRKISTGVFMTGHIQLKGTAQVRFIEISPQNSFCSRVGQAQQITLTTPGSFRLLTELPQNLDSG